MVHLFRIIFASFSYSQRHLKLSVFIFVFVFHFIEKETRSIYCCSRPSVCNLFFVVFEYVNFCFLLSRKTVFLSFLTSSKFWRLKRKVNFFGFAPKWRDTCFEDTREHFFTFFFFLWDEQNICCRLWSSNSKNKRIVLLRTEDATLNENDKKVILRKKELFKTSPIRSRKTKNIFFLHKFNFLMAFHKEFDLTAKMIFFFKFINLFFFCLYVQHPSLNKFWLNNLFDKCRGVCHWKYIFFLEKNQSINSNWTTSSSSGISYYCFASHILLHKIKSVWSK